MNPTDFASDLSPLLALVVIVLGVLLLFWLVLFFLAPFFWYGTNKRAKEISEKLTELIALQRRTPPP